MKSVATTLITLILSLSAYGAAAPLPMDPYPFTSTTDAARFATLTKEIRCIVCQHQNIAESTTPIAHGIRQKVYQMVLANKSDQEIKDYLVKRYGESILLSPRMSERTLLLWLFPFLAPLLAILILMRLFRSRHSKPTRPRSSVK